MTKAALSRKKRKLLIASRQLSDSNSACVAVSEEDEGDAICCRNVATRHADRVLSAECENKYHQALDNNCLACRRVLPASEPESDHSSEPRIKRSVGHERQEIFSVEKYIYSGHRAPNRGALGAMVQKYIQSS